MKVIILKLLERLIIDYLIFQIDRLEKKLEVKRRKLEEKLPEERLTADDL